ncbi:hypothetical protein [Burkholderia pyrrocinia]|uniref:hypothetical protein n=1 Tax=Burkholderia pyrrocinia TaxID=60550 RepID=UPI00158E9B8F|nr:hypothetical protein [Burkholderia pyrrocinia]
MINVMEEVARRLSVLAGLDVTGVSHAGDMLTLHFGPLREITTRRGTTKRVGAWALHVQCFWRIEHGGEVLATRDDLRRSEEDTKRVVEKLDQLLVKSERVIVNGISASPYASVRLSLSGNRIIAITPDDIAGDEDWRFFAPGTDKPHFVVEGGRIDPESLG